MRFPKLSVLALLGLSLSAFAETPAPVRTWTTTEGKTFQASLVNVQGTQITLRLGNGQLAAIGLPRLSPADQAYLQSATAPAVAMPPAANAATGRGPIEKRVWPQKVEVDTRAIEVTVMGEDVANRKCVYHSRNFEFTAEDKIAQSLMKEVARTFESTRSLLEALPWSIDPKPGNGTGFFKAQFFMTHESFVAAGGGANVAATLRTSDNTFLVPFGTLGLERRGKTWAKGGKYEDDLLVLEITRQMMNASALLLPKWVVDGAPEYTRNLPNNAGVILAGAHERGLKEHIKEWAQKRGIKPGDAGPVLELMQMPVDVASQRMLADDKNRLRLHFSSGLLVYYFCHLDGDGKGTRFIRFMDKIAEAREAGTPPGTRGSYGLSQLDILLEGRGKDEMQNAVVDGFKKNGIRWE